MKRLFGVAGGLGLMVTPALGQTYLPYGSFLANERPAVDCVTTHGFPWCPNAGIGVDGEIVYQSQWSAAGTQVVRFFVGEIFRSSEGGGWGGFFTIATDPKVYGGKKPPRPICFVSLAAETTEDQATLYGYPLPAPALAVWQERPGDGTYGAPLTSASVTFGWWSPFVQLARYSIYAFNVICKPNTP